MSMPFFRAAKALRKTGKISWESGSVAEERYFLEPESLPSEAEKEMLSLVYGAPELTKADIVKASSYSQTHVYLLIEGLVEKGYLEFKKGNIRGKGKPSPIVALSAGKLASVGMAFTADTVRLAMIDLSGETVLNVPLATHPNSPVDVIDAFRDKLNSIRHSHPALKLVGLGVAMQGYRTGIADQFITPTDLQAWRDKPIKEFFASDFACNVIAENNATSAAIAEHLVGGGTEADCLAYLSFNIGLGAGFVWKNKAVFGGHGNAGEISEMFFPEESHKRPALGELLKRLNDSGVKVKDLRELAERFDPEWPAVQAWIEETKPLLRRMIMAIKAIMDPTAIFFGGEAPEELRRMLVQAANISEVRRGPLESKLTPDPKLLKSGIKGDSAHIGAALLPIHQFLLDRT